MIAEKQHDEDEFTEKIVAGLHLAFERLVEQKKKTNGILVVKREGKIVHLKPDEL